MKKELALVFLFLILAYAVYPGESPLIDAIVRDDLKSVQLCLAQDADVNYIDKNGMPVWVYVLSNPSKNRLKMIKLLIDKGLNINQKDAEGGNLLMNICGLYKKEISDRLTYKEIEKTFGIDSEENLPSSVKVKLDLIKNEFIDLISVIIKNGADINEKDKYGYTALMRAIDIDASFIAEYLIRKNADINAADNKGATSLIHVAMYSDNLEIFKLLLKNKADINVKDKYGRTALYWAVIGCNNNIACFLTENGANINEKDNYGFTPLLYSIINGDIELSSYLLDHKADVNASAEYESVSEIDGIEFDLYAADNRFYNYFLTVNKNSGVNKKILPSNNALTMVIKLNFYDYLGLLLSRNADVNYRDNCGYTAFMIACLKKRFDAAMKLLANGSDINAKDISGNNLLIYAVLLDYPDLAEFLVNNRINIHAKNLRGKTALDYAKERGLYELLIYLQNKSKERS